MIRTEAIIGVCNVEKSSKWYQKLLGCKSNHGGQYFEILADQYETTILNLHKWEEHGHPTLNNPKMAENGLILYFRVDNLEEIWQNAKSLSAVIEEEPNLNQNSGRKEFSIRDIDNYYLIISL
ncbi:VOC family protein [Christiangramia salexigens]|uniref:Glyoxalase n=1 Tax=Christiangramia salexigens TaxID=1913577 RepID=A0A1L3J3Y3_9FLAO|nr:VOC family protein [Christiangramia salexigens]APG59845.1 glyoxalase [Christiangramia salexigens]